MLGGYQKIYKFDNGYGASVVSNDFSYGGSSGLYEIAVLDASGSIVYDTPVTDDVIGWLDTNGVDEILKQIQSLPKKNNVVA